ncbi:MAG: type II toxin-antitoxin system VapC family toxin [Nanoarchaeota archaeon]
MFADTTLLVDFLRGEKRAVEFIEKRQWLPLFTSEINAFELIDGVYASGAAIPTRLEKVLALLSKMVVLPFDRKSALKAGLVSGTLAREGKKIGETDCLIAGVALANGLQEIVTENKSHFERIKGLKVVSY